VRPWRLLEGRVYGSSPNGLESIPGQCSASASRSLGCPKATEFCYCGGVPGPAWIRPLRFSRQRLCRSALLNALPVGGRPTQALDQTADLVRTAHEKRARESFDVSISSGSISENPPLPMFSGPAGSLPTPLRLRRSNRPTRQNSKRWPCRCGPTGSPSFYRSPL
jgi:hypothetical protein